jgi:two-component system response regulator
MARKWQILFVDDDSDYRRLFASALQESRLDVDLFEARDGFAGMNYLLGNGPYADRARFPFPDLIILDLNMPGMDGLAVLKEIRGRLGLQNLPIIILTTSGLQSDVTVAYASRASAFHQKPSRYRDLVSLLQTVIPLWLNTPSSKQFPSDVRPGISRH